MHGGMGKEIEQSAMELILDNLQKYQYINPIKSTVREIISNGIDSISEREVAKKILKGTHRVEDFFEERDGKIYQDSKFDPSYYDLRWLSSDAKVHMTYIEGNAIEKDKVEFRDNGVGLGAYRLIKYFSLGYSTKRLSKLPLGKFGIGGKAPLSTGVDFFTMESRYNGRKFKFNVYSHTVDSIIPHGEHYIVVAEGTPQEYRVYYEPTTELNGVTISLQVKKNHKQQYIDAVKSQLLYFDSIDFNLLHDDGRLEPIAYQAEILYQDDLILLSDNSRFSKPHLLLNGVNYGYIQFEELELEDKTGNIGIKISPEEVDVNPSRESVVWSERTKSMVLARFESVVDIATKLLQKELREDDYLKWLRTCYSISNRFFASDTITGRLAKIVDLTQVKPAFLPNPNLRFSSSSNLGGLYIRTVGLSTEIIANRTKTKVVRKEMKNIQTVIDRPIVLMKKDERASNRKDKWIMSNRSVVAHVNQGVFVTIYEPMTIEEMVNAGFEADFIDHIKTSMNKRAGTKDADLNNRYETWDALCASADIHHYSDIVVPEDFKSTEDEIVEEVKPQTVEEKEVETVARLSAKERRAQEGKLLIYTPRSTSLFTVMDKAGDAVNKVYEWQKIEMPIKDMNDWDTEEIYYSDGMDELMNFVAMLSRDPDPRNGIGDPKRGTAFDKDGQHKLATWQEKKWYRLNKDKMYGIQVWNAMACQHFFDNREIKLIKTSRPNFKHLKDFRSIDRFFLTITNNTITMSNLLIRWNTARLIKDKLEKAKFLDNFSQFNQRYHEMYMELKQYLNRNWREVNVNGSGTNVFGLDAQTYDDMIKHLDKVQQFQEHVATRPTADEIKHMAEYLFGNDQLKDGMAVDPTMMKKLAQVQEYVNGCGPLFNYILDFTTPGRRIAEELEIEVKQFLEFKGMLNFKTEEDQIIDEIKEMSGPILEKLEEEVYETQRSEAIEDWKAGLTPHEEKLEEEEQQEEFHQF